MTPALTLARDGAELHRAATAPLLATRDDVLLDYAAAPLPDSLSWLGIWRQEGSAMTRRRLVITGRVQGVFYRAWFAERAAALGLDGWVRNRADGSVEAVVAGAAEMVDAMIGHAREGSPASHVEHVAVAEDAAHEPLDGFTKRPTA